MSNEEDIIRGREVDFPKSRDELTNAEYKELWTKSGPIQIRLAGRYLTY